MRLAEAARCASTRSRRRVAAAACACVRTIDAVGFLCFVLATRSGMSSCDLAAHLADLVDIVYSIRVFLMSSTNESVQVSA